MNEVIVTTPDQLRAIIYDCLKNANLISKPDPPKKQEIEAPLTQPEALKFLKKSRQTFSKWRRDGKITSHRIGGRIFYFKSELLSAMQ